MRAAATGTRLPRVARKRRRSDQTLMRSYVGAGIREDLERFEGSAIGKLIERHCPRYRETKKKSPARGRAKCVWRRLTHTAIVPMIRPARTCQG